MSPQRNLFKRLKNLIKVFEVIPIDCVTDLMIMLFKSNQLCSSTNECQFHFINQYLTLFHKINRFKYHLNLTIIIIYSMKCDYWFKYTKVLQVLSLPNFFFYSWAQVNSSNSL